MAQEVEIDSLGAQGDGVVGNGTLYVPYTLPGERVRVVRFGDWDGARARVEAVLTPSAQRIAPVCPHFGTCGGCSMQHASERFTALWKRELVVTALGARGITGVAIRPTITSPPESRRRITAAARRTRKGVLIGFHAPGDTDIVPIDSCAVAEPSLIAVAIKANDVSGGVVGVWGLRVAVAVGVAAGVALGAYRIVTGGSLHLFIMAGYIIVLLQTLRAPRAILPLAYDSGGVTTSTVTVPLVAALGLGLASTIPGRSPLIDGFGLIAFASVFPIISVLGYAQLSSWWHRRVGERRES